jgi:hypothetical protein
MIAVRKGLLNATNMRLKAIFGKSRVIDVCLRNEFASAIPLFGAALTGY